MPANAPAGKDRDATLAKCPGRSAGHRGGSIGSGRHEVSGSWARLELPAALASGTYDDANRLTGRGLASYTYDDNGNLTSDGGQSYAWNARGELSGLSGGSPSASFAYDAFGRRREATIGGTTTSFRYDGDNAIVETTGGSSVRTLAGLGTDSALTRTVSSDTEALLTDALGSTIALADGDGLVTTEYSYDPFGTPTAAGASSGNRTQFTGREWDGTGLQYSRARYYSPSLGRFVSEDPIGSAGGDANLYAYVGSSPIQRTDPTGLYWGESVVGAVAESGLNILENDARTYMRYINPTARLLLPGYGCGWSLGRRKDAGTTSVECSLALIPYGRGAKAVDPLLAWAGARPSAGTMRHFDKLLRTAGPDKLLKARRSLTDQLNEHMNKILEARASGGYTSSMLKEVRVFRSQKHAIEDLLKGMK